MVALLLVTPVNPVVVPKVKVPLLDVKVIVSGALESVSLTLIVLLVK